MITINSLSGGKTSSYLAVNYPADYEIFSLVRIDAEYCKPKDESIVRYVSEKLSIDFIATAESDKTLYVMRDLEQMIGKEIIWVTGKSFDEQIDKKGMLFNLTMRYCTTDSKIIPIGDYIVKNILPKHNNEPVFMNQGIRYDEHERAKKGINREYRNKFIVSKSANGRNKWQEFFWAVANYPLIYDRVTHPKIQKFWIDKKIDFPEDSNCVGCFWKDVQQLRKNWDEDPNKMRWFSEQEKRKNHFFKPNINYEQIKTIGIQQDFFFGTGSGCQAGFCTD
jgi:hypothetical protein